MIDSDEIRNILKDKYRDDYEKYQEYEYLISQLDWNIVNYDIRIKMIAMYILIHNPEANYNINQKRLKLIRKEVSLLKKRVLKEAIRRGIYNYYTLEYVDENIPPYLIHNNYLISILGVNYAKYFIRRFKNIDNIDDNVVNDTSKKYLIMRSISASTEDNEVYIVKSIINDIENNIEVWRNMYNKADLHNKNHTALNKQEKFSRTIIDNSLKRLIIKKLMEIGITKSKSMRLAATTINAIKTVNSL